MTESIHNVFVTILPRHSDNNVMVGPSIARTTYAVQYKITQCSALQGHPKIDPPDYCNLSDDYEVIGVWCSVLYGLNEIK